MVTFRFLKGKQWLPLVSTVWYFQLKPGLFLKAISSISRCPIHKTLSLKRYD
jgi:hypothetical protein